jgi:hypothetical protein
LNPNALGGFPDIESRGFAEGVQYGAGPDCSRARCRRSARCDHNAAPPRDGVCSIHEAESAIRHGFDATIRQFDEIELWTAAEQGFDATRDPILKSLDTIECRDALLNEDGTEAEWPDTDVIIGNPPFLGGKLLITNLGEDQRNLGW